MEVHNFCGIFKFSVLHYIFPNCRAGKLMNFLNSKILVFLKQTFVILQMYLKVTRLRTNGGNWDAVDDHK